MVQISEDLVRRRAEHNNYELSTLEEVSLHQQDIEKIEYIEKWCRELKILYLQSNLIPKIENVGRLKKLEYLNLALNNVECIENLQGCESLKKLDLTINFVGELTSIETLRANKCLEELYLTGNPCAEYEHYREYVVATLPHLKRLDGQDITKTERLMAMQEYGIIRPRVIEQQEVYRKKRETEKETEAKKLKQEEKKPGFDGRWYTDINEEDSKSENDQKTETQDEDKKFWDEKVSYTPESRIAVHEHIKEQRKREDTNKDPVMPKKERRFFGEDGCPRNVNEAKLEFSLTDDEDKNALVLELSVYRHLDTSLCDIDVQPSYIKVKVKEKVFQLVLSEEVKCDSSTALRSQTTGHLVVTMPKVKEVSKPKMQSKQKETRLQDKPKKNHVEKLEVEPSVHSVVDISQIVPEKGTSEPLIVQRKNIKERPNSSDFIDDDDVPPLM